MEHFNDLHDKFKRVTNCKMNRSSMQYDMINISSEKDPKIVNIGLGCTPTKWDAFIVLFKEYKDVFSWTYYELKTYDIRIYNMSSRWIWMKNRINKSYERCIQG